MKEQKNGNACPKLGREGDGGNQGSAVSQEHLVDVGKVAEILGCSERTVWRWRDKKLMPESITIGRVVRWSYRTIMAWIGAGCPKASEFERSV